MTAASGGTPGRLGALSRELKQLRERLRTGAAVPRERIAHLLDVDDPAVEIGLCIGHEEYGDVAPAAGVVTVVGRVEGRDVVVVATDPSVGTGPWWPDAVAKVLRAQEIAMRCRIPIVYLMDSPEPLGRYAEGAFPHRHGVGKTHYYASVMRRHLGVPQLAAIMGPCVGGSAHLAALADFIVMVERRATLSLVDAELAREVTGTDATPEELGGAEVHTEISAVAHYRAGDDEACLLQLRSLLAEIPPQVAVPERVATPPARLAYELYDLLPEDPRKAYDVRAVLECVLDGEGLDEFQPGHAPEVICAGGYLDGLPVGVVANARGLLRGGGSPAPRVGGVVYVESARKVAYFVEAMSRRGTPLLVFRDTAELMVGREAERAGIIRSGATLIEALAAATVPKLAVTLGHVGAAEGHALAGQGLDPDFTVALPSADSGWHDGVVLPEELRPTLGLLLRAALRNPGPHAGPFQAFAPPARG